MNTDTIAAIASGITSSGVGVIRISGPDSFAVADRIFFPYQGEKNVLNYKPYTMHYGYICDGAYKKDSDNNSSSLKKMVDEVVLLVFKGPKSFTGEDTIEIDCHGGVFVMNKILEIVLKNGARLADPGEFTKRAFLNGRLDLSQAESVMDVISSSSDLSLKSSLDQLNGRISECIGSLREVILHETAFIEAALDDPEHYSLDDYSPKLKTIVSDLVKKTDALISSYDHGRVVNDGINTVIVGKPNAGKSSLLNFLAGYDRAIVTDIAGTTRDTLTEKINISGITLNITDTAGIRQTEDVIEKIGVDRTYDSIEMSDLILYVCDGSKALSEEDEDIFRAIEDRIEKGHVICLVNKNDMDVLADTVLLEEKFKDRFIMFSSKTGDGYDKLKDMIYNIFSIDEIKVNEEIMISKLRHVELLKSAKEKLLFVMDGIDNMVTEDFLTGDLMGAYADLGKITGEAVEEDLVDKIFSDFCMGK
ncbi:MAG: tRNA uridine-5-carboxymethylaminomethyl(34) synthesis GTPase MnmE [Lachnospiraceae bacterium]|nr:tRNA uridine-5-carboxymethylaminomethyl(34) synthesis GTPase MnmE [Lachnospiraceae bacterium]